MSVKTKRNTFTVNITDPNQPVLLTVSIGQAQIGGSGLNWKGNPASLGKGEIHQLNLGKGADIQGRTLELFTNVVDVNPATNKVLVTYDFSNGQPNPLTLTDEVDAAGGILSFVNEINFG